MVSDWYTVHLEGFNVVDWDTRIKFFRKSKVPGSYLIKTTDELANCNVYIYSLHNNYPTLLYDNNVIFINIPDAHHLNH